MTVSKNEDYVHNWNGNGSTVNFEFDFLIEKDDQLIVLYTDSSGVQKQLTKNVDYTIYEIGNPNGSYITYPIEGSMHTVLSDDEVITLMLELPIEQDTPYDESEKLVKSRLERNFDYLTKLVAIMNKKVQRSVKVKEGNNTSLEELENKIIAISSKLDAIQACIDNEENINACVDNEENINTLAAIVDDINAVANDLENIDNASSYAGLAKDWANKMSGPVADNEFSAKYYAQQAAEHQIQADWAETDITSKGYIQNKPNLQKDVANGYCGLNASGKIDVANRIADGAIELSKMNSLWQPDLLFCFWSDHLINRPDVLRADTFSWHNGTAHSAVYNHLLADISGKTLTSETIGNTTVQYYLADDGHKICPGTEESNVLAIYNSIGVAWYYILDQANTRFKLPRTKYDFVGLRDSVGNYVPESLPNIRANGNGSFSNLYGGAYEAGEQQLVHRMADTDITAPPTNFNANKYCSTYQDNAPVQQRATQMYLYFYVGGYTQTAVEQTAGLNAELFNGKVDLNASNLNTQGKGYIVDFCMPDYASQISSSTTVVAGTLVQVDKDSFVCCWSADPNIEDYYCYVTDDTNLKTKYIVGRRADDVNSNTQVVSFTFFVPKGWWFTDFAELGFEYRIYPLKGAN